MELLFDYARLRMPHTQIPLILYESHAYFIPIKQGTPGSYEEAPGFLGSRESLGYFFTFNNTCPRRFC